MAKGPITSANQLQADGGTVTLTKNDKGNLSSVKIGIGGQTPIGTLTLASDLTKIDKFGQAALKKIDAEIPKLLKEMETFSSSTKEYLIGGESGDVDKAVVGYANMFDLINKVFGAPVAGTAGAASQQSGVKAGVTATSSGVTAQKSTALEEQKITASFLKKLISESFKR